LTALEAWKLALGMARKILFELEMDLKWLETFKGGVLKMNEDNMRTRIMELQGSDGALIFSGDKGKLITVDGETELDAGTTRGLFKKDTENVLSHLFTGKPLDTNHESILHSIAVANAAEKSASIEDFFS
jgi:hypothetical protein